MLFDKIKLCIMNNLRTNVLPIKSLKIQAQIKYILILKLNGNQRKHC